MGLSERFHYYWTELADPRVNEWVLLGPIYQIPLILLIYVYLVLYWGPRFMKNRPPYDLKGFIKFYNFFQIVANAWLVGEHLAFGWLDRIPLTCIPVTVSYEHPYYRIAQVLWFVLVLKIIDCIETMIFMLRKKNNQVSVLHVYHHITTMVNIWLMVRYEPGEMTSFITLANCSVHVLMYIYYFLAALGPRVQATISPFKPYLTIIQMIQLCAMIIYGLQNLMPSCNMSQILAAISITNISINIYLFSKFYQISYSSRKKKQ